MLAARNFLIADVALGVGFLSMCNVPERSISSALMLGREAEAMEVERVTYDECGADSRKSKIIINDFINNVSS